MKVLFVASGNSINFKIAPFIRGQGDSLEKLGLDIDYFHIKGKGISGYLKSGLRLKQYLKTTNYDLIHAHYSLSGWSAVIGSGNIPIVLSLMGSDTYGEYIGKNKVKLSSRKKTLLTLLIQPFVDKILSKSLNISKYVYLKKKSHIVPNGILLKDFNPSIRNSRKKLGLSKNKKHILFLGDKRNIRKNYTLAKNSVDIINDSTVELINPYPVPHEKVSLYLNASDVLVLTSFAEGSPNIVKEAMACNTPIVSTNVGDVEWLLDGLEGCYIAGFDPIDFSRKIKLALRYSDEKGKTRGRERLLKLGLDSESIAKKITNIYISILEH